MIEYPSQTSALLEPYLDAQGHPTSNRGPSYFTQENLNRLVAAADAASFTVHVHAIGDRAVRSALDAFAYSRQKNGPLDNRDQIAHLQLIDPADLPRFKALGVIANLQLLRAERDDYIDKGYLDLPRSRALTILLRRAVTARRGRSHRRRARPVAWSWVSAAISLFSIATSSRSTRSICITRACWRPTSMDARSTPLRRNDEIKPYGGNRQT